MSSTRSNRVRGVIGVVTGFLVLIAALSGRFVLKGTGSSIALAVVGGLAVVAGLVQIARSGPLGGPVVRAEEDRKFRAVVGAIGALVVLVGIVFIVLSYRRPTIGTIFLAIGWASIVAFYFFAVQAARALFRDEDVLHFGSADDQERADLEREKRALLKAIKEVEFDLDTGKIDKPDAEAQIALYRGRAIELMSQLETEAPKKYVDVVEAELKKRLEKASTPGLCPGCSTKNDADAEFCKKCGKPLGGKA